MTNPKSLDEIRDRLAREDEATFTQTGLNASEWNTRVRYHKHWSFKKGFSAAIPLVEAQIQKEAKRWCPCGGVILADTEDFTVPLCHSCYCETEARVRREEVEPKDVMIKQLRKEIFELKGRIEDLESMCDGDCE